MSIRVLPKILVDKIAAGEVIERPASVVKELVENSIDAGAGRIEVELENGGAGLIRVVDDGRGLAPSDLEAAFCSHATSKLETEEDLFNIKTMGFRGEALSSIASVAQARMISRTPDVDGGAEIRAEGGSIGKVKACAASPGTVVEVRNLFFNVPVRRKFLKTQATEMAHITEAVTRLALAYPEIAFVLRHNSRQVVNLPESQDTRTRLGEFFGSEIADNIIPVAERRPEIEIEGYLLPPHVDRANTTMQYTFVNKRYIREKTLMHAAGEAYRGLMQKGRRPVCFLFLTVDPKNIDVNVHPCKTEVKFRQNREIHDSVLGAMRLSLREAKLTPHVRIEDEVDPDTLHRNERVRSAIADFFSGEKASPHGERAFKDRDAPSGHRPAPDAVYPGNEEGPVSGLSGHFNAAQFLDSYIVEECEEGIRIIDQHALHEKVLYEKIKKEIGQGPLRSQKLLVPELVDLAPAEFYAVMELKEDLAGFGMEIDSFGDETVIVRSFPQILGRLDGVEFFRDLLDEANGPEGLRQVDGRVDKLLIVMACRGAVKAGLRLDRDLMRDLLEKRHTLDQPDTCPHGRPVSILLTSSQLEKQFGR